MCDVQISSSAGPARDAIYYIIFVMRLELDFISDDCGILKDQPRCYSNNKLSFSCLVSFEYSLLNTYSRLRNVRRPLHGFLQLLMDRCAIISRHIRSVVEPFGW